MLLFGHYADDCEAATPATTMDGQCTTADSTGQAAAGVSDWLQCGQQTAETHRAGGVLWRPLTFAASGLLPCLRHYVTYTFSLTAAGAVSRLLYVDGLQVPATREHEIVGLLRPVNVYVIGAVMRDDGLADAWWGGIDGQSLIPCKRKLHLTTAVLTCVVLAAGRCLSQSLPSGLRL